jgi:glycosyltransferase involved in cell wall biosynthesis
MPRIGIDLRLVHYAKTGFHRYARGLIASLERHAPNGTRFVLLRHADDDEHWTTAEHIDNVHVTTPPFSAGEADRLAREIGGCRLDAVHFPFSVFPGRIAERVFLTVHDLTCIRFPQFIEPAYLPFYRSAIGTAGAADGVMAVSRQVGGEVARAGVPPAKIHVGHPITPFDELGNYWMPGGAGADRDLVKRLTTVPYLLSVGSLEPRKNHLALLAAFEKLRRRGGERLRLVLAGSHGWLSERLLRAIAAHPFRDDILLERRADDAVLRHLLRHCRLYVQCSLYEGFCLPVLEALAEGACVLSTPVPSLLESGFPEEGFIDAADADGVAGQMAAVLCDRDRRDRLAERSRRVVRDFYRSLDAVRLARLYDL